MIPNVLETENGCPNGFLCGVVEGFYGRPWTTEQRKRLFKRMNMMGMNTYLYAPKDDCKHRMYWRDLYTVEEADHLSGLIEAAESENVSFVYALSPGLDMAYSSNKEVCCLKRKLEQVASFGCKSFALLFDDIDVDMGESDKAIFQSFAHAQVSVTNEVYQHLNQPAKFLFCPTEYCATRAVPTVSLSDYLTTIGSKLLPSIDVMWTGPKVISKKISIKSIEEISKVLKRPPVIWDNIHANDYDQRRLFLGPYCGRSTELIPYLRGVLTNPNCEYEANFIAMHTLAEWSKSNVGGAKKDVIHSDSPVSADIKLETDGEYISDEDIPANTAASYQPKQALTVAISDWLNEFYCRHSPVTKILPSVAPPPPISTTLADGVVTCSTECPVTTALPQSSSSSDPDGSESPIPLTESNLKELHNFEVNDLYMQPTTIVPVNSLVDPSSSDSETDSCCNSSPEPMDCASSTTSSTLSGNSLLSQVMTEDSPIFTSVTHDTAMQVEVAVIDNLHLPADSLAEVLADPSTTSSSHSSPSSSRSLVSTDDLTLLVDLFYTPFEHGSHAVTILNEFCWLKANAHHLTSAKAEDATAEQLKSRDDWHQHLREFQQKLRMVMAMIKALCAIPNRAMLFELYPYVWDLNLVVLQVDTFVSWLALEHSRFGLDFMPKSPYTWCNTKYSDEFGSGAQEPWVFRGGLQAELQRMLPLDNVVDLLFHTCPPEPMIINFRVRPYVPEDEVAVYEVCRRTCDDGMDGTEIFPEQPNLIGDKLVGPFLQFSPEYCFVIENEEREVCGYVLAALDAQEYVKQLETSWLPSMRQKYPKPDKEEGGLTPAEEIIAGFHTNTQTFLPEALYSQHPASVRMDFLPELRQDGSMTKLTMAAAVAALKSSAVDGIYTEIHIGDHNTVEFYNKLGFFNVPLANSPDGLSYLARVI